MTNEEVQAKLNYWLAGIVGIPDVIDANSDRARPGLPYVTSNLMLSGKVGEYPSDYDYTDDGENATQIPVWEWFWRFSVTAYGGKPMEILRKVETAFPILTYHDKLRPLNLFEISDIRNIPELVENKIEARANVDIEVRGINRDGLPVDVIETHTFDFERV